MARCGREHYSSRVNTLRPSRLLPITFAALSACSPPVAPDAAVDVTTSDIVVSDAIVRDDVVSENALDASADARDREDSSAPSDAVAPPDSGSDTGVPQRVVTVIVRDGTTPQPNARVAFFDAMGTLVATTTTNGDGEARQALGAGGIVVAVPRGASDSALAFVWAGVQPGDVLPVTRPLAAGVDRTTTIRLPTVAGAGRWQVDTRCGVRNSLVHPVAIDLPETCVRSDIVATYYNASSVVLGTVTALDQAITPGGEVDLSTRTFRATRPANPAFTGLPRDRVFASISAQTRFGAVNAPEGIFLSSTMPGDLSAEGELPDTMDGGVIFHRAQISVAGGRLFVERVANAVSPIAFDTISMPVISGVDYVVGTRRMRVTTVAPSTGTPALVPNASYVRLTSVVAGRRVEWNVFAPPFDAITLPTLPASMADAEIPLVGSPSFEVIRTRAPSSFDEMRARVYTLGSVSELLSGAGDLVYSAYSTAR